MNLNQWLIKNRNKQNIHWFHHRIKEELGNKKYQELIRNQKLKEIERKINNQIPISKLLEDLLNTVN